MFFGTLFIVYPVKADLSNFVDIFMRIFANPAFSNCHHYKDHQTARHNGDRAAQTESVTGKTHKPGEKSASGYSHCRKVDVKQCRIKVRHTLDSVHLSGRPIGGYSDARQKEQNKKQYEQPCLREHSGMHIRKRKRYRDRPQ